MNCSPQSLVNAATSAGYMDMPVKQLMATGTYLSANGGGGGGPVWILATGFWNDNGVWIDTAVWID